VKILIINKGLPCVVAKYACLRPDSIHKKAHSVFPGHAGAEISLKPLPSRPSINDVKPSSYETKHERQHHPDLFLFTAITSFSQSSGNSPSAGYTFASRSNFMTAMAGSMAG